MFDIQLINLEGSDARLLASSAALQAAGLEFRRLPAFDGRKLLPEELPLYSPDRARRDFGRNLTGGEVGCFLSHLEAARRFLATDKEFGLVLEDDLTVPANAAAVMALLEQSLVSGIAKNPWMLANLGEPARRYASTLSGDMAGHVLMRAHYFPVTTTAILWNREGAAAFLQDANDITMPVDHWLRRWATRRDCGLALNPPLFPASNSQSEIDAAGQRKAIQRGFRYFWAKQSRLWTNKFYARQHRARF